MAKRFIPLKDLRQEKNLFNLRISIVAIVIGLLVTLLIVRLFHLQIIQHQRYTTLARQNQLNISPLEPYRGLIYDRNGVLLAENIPVYNLVVTPSRVSNLRETIEELKKIVAISDNDLRQFYKQLKLHRQFETIPLHIKLTEEEVARFAVDQYRYPGVAIQAEMIRHYPLGDVFAPVVGYVGRINATELSKVDPGNYSSTNFIGKTGVEKYYEAKLHGVIGIQQAESDARGRVVRILNRTPSIAGSNLYLTVDSQLQMVAQQALGKLRGAVIALDPQTGEVLALVSNPSFNPNLFVNGISKEDYNALHNAAGEPLFNRALRGRYPPGSTIKPFLALEGLRSGVVTAEYTIYDPGWFQLPNSTRVYRNYHNTAHGSVNASKAITVSSDTYFYNLATKMGVARIDKVLQEFGFGKQTNIDLDGESSGIVPTPEWKKRVYGQPWYPGDTVITGIGQGFMLTTPLQLATGVSALAMHGQRFQPHVLLKVQSDTGAVEVIKPVALSPIQADEKNWKLVLTAMQNVTTSGTAAQYFQGTGYTVAGKTGTAQVFSLKKNQKYNSAMLPERLRDNSLFIAFAPVDNPRIAVAIMAQNSNVRAAQIARTILDYYFLKKRVGVPAIPVKPKAPAAFEEENYDNENNGDYRDEEDNNQEDDYENYD